jgi:hypothetical protein
MAFQRYRFLDLDFSESLDFHGPRIRPSSPPEAVSTAGSVPEDLSVLLLLNMGF